MTTIIEKKHFRLISTIAANIAASTGIDQSDLEAEAISKIPNILRNFNSKTGVPFDNYFNLSIRGYCLNYRRDKSFISVIPRSDLAIYLSCKKYNSLEEAALRMGLSVTYLEQLNLTVTNNRNFSTISTENEWMLPIDDSNECEYKRLFHSCGFTLTERELLEDVYLDRLSLSALTKKYGRDFEDQKNKLVSRLYEKRESTN